MIGTEASMKMRSGAFPKKPQVVMFAILFQFLLFHFSPPLNAQLASGGALTGTVTGEAGAAMPGVQVSVQGVGTNVTRTATTNENGIFSVQDLPVGKYEMTVSAPGFVTQVWTDITVTAGIARTLNTVMRAGNADQVVRAAAPLAPVSEVCGSSCGSANA